MDVTFRLPHLAGVLLLLAAPWAGADSFLPDPVAPAVIGRPLDQIRPVRPVHRKPVAVKPERRPQVASASKAVHTARPAQVAIAPAPVQRAPAAPPTAQMGAAPVRVAVRPFGPGNYFSSRDYALVRTYYDAHPVSGETPQWQLGEPIPPRAELTGVPDDLRAALSALPPGHQYVEIDGDVVAVAVQSRVVVDGIRRGLR
jgi:hypothetical protein